MSVARTGVRVISAIHVNSMTKWDEETEIQEKYLQNVSQNLFF